MFMCIIVLSFGMMIPNVPRPVNGAHVPNRENRYSFGVRDGEKIAGRAKPRTTMASVAKTIDMLT